MLALCWSQLKRVRFLLLSGQSLFFAHASPPLPVRGLWEFQHILIIILIQFKFVFLFYLLIHYWKKSKMEKLQASMKYPLKFGRQENLMTFFLVYKHNSIDKWKKGCILPFPKKSDPRITKTYRDITLTATSAKVYNALLLNCIWPEIKKILWKNQNNFQRNHSTILQILTIHQIIRVWRKNIKATLLFIDFSKAFDSIHRGKMEQILLV